MNYDEIKVQAKDLVDKVKALIREGNTRRIIIKDEKGNTFIEVPVNVAALGVIAAPVLAAVGAIAAFVSSFTLIVEKRTGPEEAASETKTPVASNP
jgi:hypothetical protein